MLNESGTHDLQLIVLKAGSQLAKQIITWISEVSFQARPLIFQLSPLRQHHQSTQLGIACM